MARILARQGQDYEYQRTPTEFDVQHPSLWRRGLGTALTVTEPIWKTFEAGDKAARWLAARATGMSGRDVPTGEELYEYWTGTELPANIPGKWQMRDVPGFATEMAVSPWNVLGIGAATKTGRAAIKTLAQAKKAQKLAWAGKKVPAELRPFLDVPIRARPSLYAQALAGERSIVSLMPIGFGRKMNIPLVPRQVSAAAFAPFSKAAGPARRLFEPIAKLGRIGGRIPPHIRRVVEEGGELSGEQYNTLLELAEDARRAGRHGGMEERILISDFLRRRSPIEDAEALDRVGAVIGRSLDDIVGRDPKMQRLRRKLGKVAPDDPQMAGIEEELGKRREQILRQQDWMRGVGQKPSEELLGLGLLVRGVPGKLEALKVSRGREIGQKIKNWRRIRDAATDAKTRSHAQGQIARLVNATRNTMVQIGLEGNLKQDIWDALPTQVQDEVSRIGQVVDESLQKELFEGLHVMPLADVHLGYLYRTLTPEGAIFARALHELELKGPFAQFWKKLTTETDFTRRRNRAWEGMTHWQIDQEAHNLANELRKSLPDHLKHRIKFGRNPGDHFFVNDVDDIILRRLTASGRLKGNAIVHRVLLTHFAIPDTALTRKPGDISATEYLARAGLDKEYVAQKLKGTDWENMIIPHDFAAAALKVERAFQVPDQITAMGKWFDQYNSAMRFWVTQVFPAYHIRNALSNGYMLWMAGVPARYIFKALKASKLAKSGLLKRGANLTKNEAKALAIMREMAEPGALGETMVQAEIVGRLGMREPPFLRARPEGRLKALPRALGRAAVAPAATGPGRRAVEFGIALENNAKIAMYLHGKATGMSAYDAAQRVKKYLFDYSELGPLDKKIRRIAFFWTFNRKAVPLMFQEMVHNPAKMRLYGLASGKLGDTLQHEMLAGYERGRDPMAVALDSRGQNVFLTLGLPPESMNILSGEGKPGLSSLLRIGQKMAAQLAPLPRVPLEMIAQRRFASGRAGRFAEELRGATPASRLISTAKRIQQVAEAKRPLGDLGGLFGLGTIRKEPHRGRLRKLLLTAEASLAEEALAGKLKRWTGYAPFEEDPDLRKLIRGRGQLEQALMR